MVKFIKPGKCVIVLTGRQAGKKAVILKTYEEGVKGKKFPMAVIAGLGVSPKPLSEGQTLAQKKKRSSIGVFVKLINITHLMPTRYGLDLETKAEITAETVADATKRHLARRELRRVLRTKLFEGKNKWFFSKLKF